MKHYRYHIHDVHGNCLEFQSSFFASSEEEAVKIFDDILSSLTEEHPLNQLGGQYWEVK